MDYDFKKIAICTCIATVVALAVGALLAFLNVGEYSFAVGLVVGGLVAGYVDKGIDSSLLEGGLAGLLVGFLQGAVASLVLSASAAAVFTSGISILFIMAGAIPAAVIAIILSERNN